MTVDRLSVTDRKSYEKRYYQDNKERIKARKQAWQAANPLLAKSYELAHRYGITLEEFNSLNLSQNGCCAVCGDVMDTPHIDHDHQTGSIRGLLCRQCNLGLGYFGDSPERLRMAANYLERNIVN